MLKFTKMHGAGNDFIVLDATERSIDLSPEQLRRLADRHLGIGADQILVVGTSTAANIDFTYRIFNSDGGEVEQCGNGARAFVRFVRERGLTEKRVIRVSTRAGIIEPRVRDDGLVSVDMGTPIFAAAMVPFDASGLVPRERGNAAEWPLDVGGEIVWVAVLSMGNPHAVQIVADVAAADVGRLGPLIESHERFPNRVNAGFLQPIDRHRAKLRVYERGAGETLSCGTGACAAVVSAILLGELESPVEVDTRGGSLIIKWGGANTPVIMTGPAVTVFEGEIDLALLAPAPPDMLA